MFGFFSMANNYDDRAVARYEENEDFIIDTCYVDDAEKPFETGIKHPEYNNGKWIIVEDYDSKNEAKAGHERWVKIMTKKELPEQLIDINTSIVAQLNSILFGEDRSVYRRAV